MKIPYTFSIKPNRLKIAIFYPFQFGERLVWAGPMGMGSFSIWKRVDAMHVVELKLHLPNTQPVPLVQGDVGGSLILALGAVILVTWKELTRSF